MFRYLIAFAASGSRFGSSSEHTRVIELAEPIEYDSDIELVQQWAAKEVGAATAMLTNWHPLKGKHRPTHYHCLTCQIEVEVGYECRCTKCHQLMQPGALPVTDIQ